MSAIRTTTAGSGERRSCGVSVQRRPEPDVSVPCLGVAVGVVGVGQHADRDQRARLLAERATKVDARVARERLPLAHARSARRRHDHLHAARARIRDDRADGRVVRPDVHERRVWQLAAGELFGEPVDPPLESREPAPVAVELEDDARGRVLARRRVRIGIGNQAGDLPAPSDDRRAAQVDRDRVREPARGVVGDRVEDDDAAVDDEVVARRPLAEHDGDRRPRRERCARRHGRERRRLRGSRFALRGGGRGKRERQSRRECPRSRSV